MVVKYPLGKFWLVWFDVYGLSSEEWMIIVETLSIIIILLPYAEQFLLLFPIAVVSPLYIYRLIPHTINTNTHKPIQLCKATTSKHSSNIDNNKVYMMDDIHQQDDIGDDENPIGDNSDNDEDAVTDDEIIEIGEDEVEVVDVDENVLQRLKQNDPTISGVHITLFTKEDKRCFNSIDWKEDGNFIANNTHLKKLRVVLGQDKSMRQQLQYFFSSIHQNRSIEELEITSDRIDKEFGMFIIEGLCGHSSLIRLKIRRGKLGSTGCEALGKVLNHPKSKLKELCVPQYHLNDDAFKILCNALLGNSTIKSLYLTNNQVSSIGWQALSTVLRHPNCTLTNVCLSSTGLNDESANVLGSALRGSTVKKLNLSYNCTVSRAGWQTLLNQLQHSSIDCLDLYTNQIDDSGLHALANVGTLKSSNLADLQLCIPSGWQFFFNQLQINGTRLKKLNISCNNIGNEGIIALGSLLSNMSSLKELNMHSIPRHHGWLLFFNALQDSNLNLGKLFLGNNNIDDEGIQLLIRLVSSMTSLKRLDLGMNRLITPTGWQAFTGYLQRPNIALEDLDLASNKVNDDTVVGLTSVLTHNKTLKRLCLHDCTDEDDNELITERGWQAASNLLCNTTSILDTYNSNHTLRIFGGDIADSIRDLTSQSTLNRNEDKVEVARQKILQTHFSDSDDTSKMQEFLDMELEVMPSVIAWIGRPTSINWKGTNVSGLSVMYNLLRRIPDLFDSSSAQKKSGGSKRKR